MTQDTNTASGAANLLDLIVNLYGCEWDAAIDSARKQGEKQ